MTFARTLFVGTLLWVGAITFLHATLNWNIFDPEPVKSFKVGFLPVT